MNQFLIGMVWNVAVLAGGGNMDGPLQSFGADTSVTSASLKNRFEARFGQTLADNQSGASFEFRHSWLPYLSSDFYLSTNEMRGLGVGLSLDPFSMLSAQGTLGIPSYTERVADGPTFDPEYTFGVRAALLIPLDLLQSRLYLSLSGGKSWVIDTNYDPSAGMPTARADDIIVPTPIRKEIRTVEFVEIGLGVRF